MVEVSDFNYYMHYTNEINNITDNANWKIQEKIYISITNREIKLFILIRIGFGSAMCALMVNFSTLFNRRL